jgi:hypothetical protein
MSQLALHVVWELSLAQRLPSELHILDEEAYLVSYHCSESGLTRVELHLSRHSLHWDLLDREDLRSFRQVCAHRRMEDVQTSIFGTRRKQRVPAVTVH